MRNFLGSSAEVAWLFALENGDRREQAEAALRLADTVAQRGDDEQAVRLLRAVCQDGDEVWAARSAFMLGQVLVDSGDRIQAEMAFALATGMSDPALTPDVHNNLAARCAALGCAQEAEDLYAALLAIAETAHDRDLLDEAGVAAARLGDLLTQRQAFDEAEIAYRRAMESGHDQAAAHAALALAEILGWQERRIKDVEALLRFAIALDDPNYSPEAALELAARLERRGESAAALELYEAVRSAGHAQSVNAAADGAARLLEQGARRYIEVSLERSFASVTQGDSCPSADLILAPTAFPAQPLGDCGEILRHLRGLRQATIVDVGRRAPTVVVECDDPSASFVDAVPLVEDFVADVLRHSPVGGAMTIAFSFAEYAEPLCADASRPPRVSVRISMTDPPSSPGDVPAPPAKQLRPSKGGAVGILFSLVGAEAPRGGTWRPNALRRLGKPAPAVRACPSCQSRSVVAGTAPEHCAHVILPDLAGRA